MLSLVPRLVSTSPRSHIRLSGLINGYSSNKTTLEDITHTFPTALIGSEATQFVQWRGDHLLGRDERVGLRNEASALNVYDMGWRRNLKSIFCPDQQISIRVISLCLWPPARPRDRYVSRPRQVLRMADGLIG